jgi:hypothetical protein
MDTSAFANTCRVVGYWETIVRWHTDIQSAIHQSDSYLQTETMPNRNAKITASR